MTLVSLLNKANEADKKTRRQRAAIPLIREPATDMTKNPSVTINVGRGSKETHHKFSRGTLEEIIDIRRTIEEVILAQELTSGPRQYQTARRFLCHDALSFFNTTAEAVGNETTANLKIVLDRFVENYFPPKALAEQKRYMRRYLQKPFGMVAKDFFARINEINGKLARFPPFQENQSMSEDEVQDILEGAIPREWQKANVFLGFDPLEKTQKEFLDKYVKYKELEAKAEPKKRNDSTGKGKRLDFEEKKK